MLQRSQSEVTIKKYKNLKIANSRESASKGQEHQHLYIKTEECSICNKKEGYKSEDLSFGISSKDSNAAKVVESAAPITENVQAFAKRPKSV